MARKFFNQSVRVNKNTGRVTVTRRIGSVTTTESYSAEEWTQKNAKPKKQKQVKNKEEKQPSSLSKSIKNTGILLTIMSLFFIFAGTGIFTLPIGIYLINLANKIND